VQNCEKLNAPQCPDSPPEVRPLRRIDRFQGGITLVETLVSMLIILVGLAGLYTTAGQSFALLRRAKELVAAREDILARLDSLRVLSYSELTQSSYVSANVMQTGTAGDATPFGMTTYGMKNFKETLTVYALGWQVFSNDSARINATPDWGPSGTGVPGEYASEITNPAPAAPATYQSNSAVRGDWTLQVANALPSYTITRTGTGSSAVVATTSSTSTTPMASCPQLRVDLTYSWTDSNNVARSQTASMIYSKSSTLP
jgi:type II secretory pathway pseudopilin PulG